MDAALLQNILLEMAQGRGNAAVARSVGCDRRTVRRYRRLVRTLDVGLADLATWPPGLTHQMLNTRVPIYSEPDFEGLSREFPSTTARFRFERYRERMEASGSPSMSEAQFNRLRVKHGFLHNKELPRFNPHLPPCSKQPSARWHS